MFANSFVGEHEYAVDPQRRVALPKGWRRGDADGPQFILFPGRDQSLQLVPAAAFHELFSKVQKVSFADAQSAIALATIGAMAQDVTLDKQGRMSMSAKLMAHAGIKDRVLLIGAMITIQVWNPDIWAGKRISSEAGLDALQEIQQRPDEITDVLRRAARS